MSKYGDDSPVDMCDSKLEKRLHFALQCKIYILQFISVRKTIAVPCEQPMLRFVKSEIIHQEG